MANRVRRPVLLVAIGLSLVVVSTSGILRPHTPAGATAAVTSSAPPPATSHPDPLQASIAAAQAHLRIAPQDWAGWAELGSAYVQAARVTSDPSYYPKADGALQRSLVIHPSANAAAMVGMAALSAARHDFAASLEWGRRAEAAAPDAGAVYGVVDDALTQLGRYPEARIALQRMLDIQPSIASFTRASYDLEEHGDVAGATTALQRALADASTPSDVAFCRYYLGELAFNSGDVAGATQQYRAARQADSSYVPALEGIAKVEAAQGKVDAALRDYHDVLARLPLPQYVNEVLDYEQSLGRTGDADALLALFRTEVQLFAGSGVDVDLESALVNADHGDAATAVHDAEGEWSRRHSVLIADALAWALHQSGRDAEALPYANQALSLGWQNALMYFHRGVIEHALGMNGPARLDLSTTEKINPFFSTLWGAVASRTLAALGGTP
jgi:tetratricopeptide (TPR) repeat protein